MNPSSSLDKRTASENRKAETKIRGVIPGQRDWEATVLSGIQAMAKETVTDDRRREGMCRPVEEKGRVETRLRAGGTGRFDIRWTNGRILHLVDTRRVETSPR